MKAKYLDDDFLLDTREARELYHGHAAKMPIIDYHCHLPPAEIACDQRWDNIAQPWLGGDHYKWRQMRSCGIEERLCTGDAPWREKFDAFAAAMEKLVGNPLFDWSHLELARYFGVRERLCRESAGRIWKKCCAKMAQKSFSAQGLMKKSRVRVVCTTDDPIDSLEHHLAIAAKPFGVQVRPAWRSDKLSKIADMKPWNAWVDALAAAAGMEVRTVDDLRAAMAKRREFFAKAGCLVSDYGVQDLVCEPYRESDLRRVFRKARGGGKVSREEADLFRSAWLFEGLRADCAAGWTAQLHACCLRDNNKAALAALGPDTGFDCMGDWPVAEPLSRLLDRLEREDALPRIVLYSLNPKDMEPIATLMGCFQKGPVAGKLQLGAAWWFLDRKGGMERHLEILSGLGSLGCFVGMLTDSRSFLSYARHEYFRRILCRRLGREAASGELPRDLDWLGSVVEDVSFNNANRYFGLNA